MGILRKSGVRAFQFLHRRHQRTLPQKFSVSDNACSQQLGARISSGLYTADQDDGGAKQQKDSDRGAQTPSPGQVFFQRHHHAEQQHPE